MASVRRTCQTRTFACCWLDGRSDGSADRVWRCLMSLQDRVTRPLRNWWAGPAPGYAPDRTGNGYSSSRVHVCTAALFTTTKRRGHPECPSAEEQISSAKRYVAMKRKEVLTPATTRTDPENTTRGERNQTRKVVRTRGRSERQKADW